MKNEEKFIYQPSFRTKDECLEFYDHLPLEISSNEFGMHDFRLRTADGERIQQHYTLHFVLRGKGTLLLSGKKYELQENYLFVTPPCVKVTTTPSAEDPWKYFWFGFNGNAAQQLVSLADFSLNKPVFLTNNDKRVRKIIDDLIKDTRRKNSPCRLFALSALLEIFAVIITERKKATAAHKPDFSTDEYIKRAVQIIEERYTDPGFKTSDISKALFISHSYLCRIFNQYTYVTPRQYLIQYRMEQARVYLEKTNESVQKICELVGFNDYLKSFNPSVSAFKTLASYLNGRSVPVFLVKCNKYFSLQRYAKNSFASSLFFASLGTTINPYKKLLKKNVYFNVSKLQTENLEFLLNYFPVNSDKTTPFLDSIHQTVIINCLTMFLQSILSRPQAPVWLQKVTSRAKLDEYLQNNVNYFLQGIPYSKRHICRAFQKYYNMSPTEYLTKAKIVQATNYLMDKNLLISDIAQRLGFCTQSGFIKAFKTYFTMSPNAWRKKYLTDKNQSPTTEHGPSQEI